MMKMLFLFCLIASASAYGLWYNPQNTPVLPYTSSTIWIDNNARTSCIAVWGSALCSTSYVQLQLGFFQMNYANYLGGDQYTYPIQPNYATPGQNSYFPEVTMSPVYSAGRIDPRLKFAPTYVQELKPWGATVLLSPAQADSTSEYGSKYRAIVVAVGPGVSDTAIKEGALVVTNPTSGCLDTWASTIEYSATYPLYSYRGQANVGAYKNGVNLNNGQHTILNMEQKLIFGQEGTQTSVTNPLTPLYGTTIPFVDANGATMSLDANQRQNYVLCPYSSIIGIINLNPGGIKPGDGITVPQSTFEDPTNFNFFY